MSSTKRSALLKMYFNIRIKGLFVRILKKTWNKKRKSKNLIASLLTKKKIWHSPLKPNTIFKY